jgi:hypothetical protein
MSDDTTYVPASSEIPFVELDTLEKSRIKCLSQDVRESIEECIRDVSGAELNRDLELSMPRLEEVRLEKELQSGDEEEESLSEVIKSYVSVLSEFNNYVGQGIENTLVQHLNNAAYEKWSKQDQNLQFARNTVQFPDLLLVDEEKDECFLHVEVKSWYIFASDPITARFHTAPEYIKDDCLLVVFPWYMTEIVSGTPKLLSPLVGSAKELAERRDQVWIDGYQGRADPGTKKVETPPPGHLWDNPINQHNIKSIGYQRSSTEDNWEIESDNFGKVYRFYHPLTYDLKDDAYGKHVKGKEVSEWREILDLD